MSEHFSRKLKVAGNSDGTGRATVSISVRATSIAIVTQGWAHLTLDEACKLRAELEDAIAVLVGRIGPQE